MAYLCMLDEWLCCFHFWYWLSVCISPDEVQYISDQSETNYRECWNDTVTCWTLTLLFHLKNSLHCVFYSKMKHESENAWPVFSFSNRLWIIQEKFTQPVHAFLDCAASELVQSFVDRFYCKCISTGDNCQPFIS